MARRATPASPPSARRDGHNLNVALVAGAALLATMWVVGQSGLAASNPVKFAVNVLIVLESLVVLGPMWLGAAGLGYALRRVLLPEARDGVVVQLGLGMAALLGAGWVLAWAGWLSAFTVMTLWLAGIVLLLVQVALAYRARVFEQGAADSALRLSWAWPLAMPGLGLMLVAAACPPGTLWRVEAMGYDVVSYHLQLPREWLAMGAMTGLEHNVYSYLPSLVEAAYMQFGALHGSMHDAIYTAQLFHISLAALAALAVGCAAARFAGSTAGIVAGAALLAVPWVVITGSLAYNEMAMLAFGATALLVLFDDSVRTWRGAAVIGALLGAATLAKLTAGLTLAVPIGVIALLGLHRVTDAPTPWRANVRFAAVMALAGLVMLSPYFARNAMWTGNPVFPFATDVLGTGHWTDDEAQRWHAGHSPGWGERGRAAALAQQWLFNTGYGAIGGYATERRVADVARFDREGGVSMLWLAVAAAAVLTWRQRGTRHVAVTTLSLIALQLVMWLLFTHLQSRFLVATLLPAGILIGTGLGRLGAVVGANRAWVLPTAGAALVLALAGSSAVVLHQQTLAVRDARGVTRPAPPSLLIDALAEPDGSSPHNVGDHAINALGDDTKTYLVADNQSLLYIRRPIVYHTPFDPSPLGATIRRADGDPAQVNRLLRERGVTHVWINWSELARLHGTYGYDADVTRETLKALIAAGWRVVRRHGDVAALYELPERP